MYRARSIAVVVPAYNEARHIASMLTRLPQWVDRIFVVDDSSHDRTRAEADSVNDPRVRIVAHTTNRGVGGAILTGYRHFQASKLDIAVVMAGDGQMDAADLPALLDPIVEGTADYVKGNRFPHPDTPRRMPRVRLVGNLALSFFTRLASGFRGVMDSQCGYTAVTHGLLSSIDFSSVYPRYGFPNDFLAHVHSAGGRLAQVVVRPVYEGQASGINPLLAVLPLSYVLLRSGLMRRSREAAQASNGNGRSAHAGTGHRAAAHGRQT
jgi:glycosyltransferase involved in cell wall biosynthesis